jgi:predicted phage baseplate assembly protein
MGLETPRLDDRSFKDLVDEARRRIPIYTPEWTDHNLSDPGITLIELFAWLTDIMLYRLNRVPDKIYIKLMDLIGMRLAEGEPARVPVTFWLSAPQERPVSIPEGTEVATTRTETEQAVVFSTDVPAEVLVPTLRAVLTSSAGTGGREFTAYEPRRVQGGGQTVRVFESDPPQAGDALYIGFDEDLSFHLIGIEISVDSAEGAGIDPSNPPYVWETLSTDAEVGWVPLEMELDDTLGLNVNGLMRMHLPRIERGTRQGINAYWVRLRLDPARAGYSYINSPTINRMNISSWGITVETTNVQRARNEMLGRSDGSPGQVFFLVHTPIVPRLPNEYLLVRHEDGREERWTEVADFASSKPEDLHYTIDANTGEVRLGPAMTQRDGSVLCYGAIPPKGAGLVMRQYRYGGGSQGNLSAKTINQLNSSIPYISRVLNRFPARGGIDGEPLENAKVRVPAYLRSLNRAVTAADFEYLAMEASRGAVARVHCLQPPQSTRGEVKLLVIPQIPNMRGAIAPESLALSKDLINSLTAYLDERRLLGTRLEVMPPAYVWVETEVRLKAAINADPESVITMVEGRLYDFLNPITGGHEGKGWPFGRAVSVADVLALLLTQPGISFVRDVRLYPVAYDRGQFVRGEAATQVVVPENAVVVSYHHEVINE